VARSQEGGKRRITNQEISSVGRGQANQNQPRSQEGGKRQTRIYPIRTERAPPHSLRSILGPGTCGGALRFWLGFAVVWSLAPFLTALVFWRFVLVACTLPDCACFFGGSCWSLAPFLTARFAKVANIPRAVVLI